MLPSEKLAIAAHLHVLLRRKTGRVTDTEWMANNLEYATEVVRFARQSASEDGHADLAEWADKLEHAMSYQPRPRVPPPRARDVLPVPADPGPVSVPAVAEAPRYVRGIR